MMQSGSPGEAGTPPDSAQKQGVVERLDNVSHWTVEYTTQEERPNPVSEAGRYYQRNGSTEVIASDVHRALEILCDAYPNAVVHVIRKTSRFRSILIDRVGDVHD